MWGSSQLMGVLTCSSSASLVLAQAHRHASVRGLQAMLALTLIIVL
jgi:hypothetical protein